LKWGEEKAPEKEEKTSGNRVSLKSPKYGRRFC